MTPPRRWSFGLRTMLLGVALTAVMSAVGARYLEEWLYPAPEFEVYGAIRRAELFAICDAIAKSPQVKAKVVRAVTVDGPSDVHVMSSLPTDSFEGEFVELKKKNGAWIVTKVTGWIS